VSRTVPVRTVAILNGQVIIDFAAAHRLPAVYQATAFVESAGLMAWAPDLVEQYRDAARYVDQVLKGASPGDLPARYPSGYFLTINAGTATAVDRSVTPARSSACAGQMNP
jgi:putative ABC transport system substrate-binding protein